MSTPQLFAACMLLLLLGSPVYAARLQSMAWTDTTVADANQFNTTLAFPAEPTAAQPLYLQSMLTNASISDYTGPPEDPAKLARSPLNSSEFSALGTITGRHRSITDVPRQNHKTNDGTQAGDAAAMPLMVLAWLFGIGIIGIGTVGRRRRKQP